MYEVKDTNEEFDKYEEFRKFYAESEDREQKLIVQVQKLMIINKNLERGRCNVKK